MKVNEVWVHKASGIKATIIRITRNTIIMGYSNNLDGISQWQKKEFKEYWVKECVKLDNTGFQCPKCSRHYILNDKVCDYCQIDLKPMERE